MSKPVQFVGIYKDAFEDFIKYRRSLGYKYGIAKEREFFRLNIHLNGYGCDKVMLTERMVREYGSVKNLQVNMKNIRKKMGVTPGEKRYIINELGVGYRMLAEDEA